MPITKYLMGDTWAIAPITYVIAGISATNGITDITLIIGINTVVAGISVTRKVIIITPSKILNQQNMRLISSFAYLL